MDDRRATFAALAQRDAGAWADRAAMCLDELESLLREGQILAAAIDARVGVPSPLGAAPAYPGLRGPVIAVLRAPDLRAAVERWKWLKERIR
jgi:hypothetical protein